MSTPRALSLRPCLGTTLLAGIAPLLGDPVPPEVSLTAPTDVRVVQGSSTGPLSFEISNLDPDGPTTFDVGLTDGSSGTINSLIQPAPIGTQTAPGTPWPNLTLGAGAGGSLLATPSLTGLTAGQSTSFGLAATSAGWTAPASASTQIGVVANRQLTGSLTIDAGRHIVGLGSLGTLTLSGGDFIDSEATRISVHGGGYAQLHNGLRLTSASDFTFNDAGQTHDLQVSYTGQLGNYNLTNVTLPGAGVTSYTDGAGTLQQDFGGYWRVEAEYGNLFGETQDFTFTGYGRTPGQWPSYNQAYEAADSAQPVIPASLSAFYSPVPWELARGSGISVNERRSALMSGEVIPGSFLDLSQIQLNVTGTAVQNRQLGDTPDVFHPFFGLPSETIDLGRRMVGSTEVTFDGSSSIAVSTSGSDDHATRVTLGGFNESANGVTVTHAGPALFDGAADVSQVQVSGNFLIDTSVAGLQTRTVNVGGFITGEGLAGETVQSTLNIGYRWNNVLDNSLVASDLLVIDRAQTAGSATYHTYVEREHSLQTHTAIGWTGDEVTVNRNRQAGSYSLGNFTVNAVAEGLAGENANASDTFAAYQVAVRDAAFTLTHSGAAGAPLGEGTVFTLTDTGSGLFQNTISLDQLGMTGQDRLAFGLVAGGGGTGRSLAHGEARTFTVDYLGPDLNLQAGSLSRIFRGTLAFDLGQRVQTDAIMTHLGLGSSSTWENSSTLYLYGSNDLAYRTFELEQRFDAPAAAIGSASLAAGTDLGQENLALINTTANTSERFAQASDVRIADSESLSGGSVTVEFIKIDEADPSLVAALEDPLANSSSMGGIYLGGGVIQFASDWVDLTGLDGVMHVLEIGYDPLDQTFEGGAQLLWQYSFTDGNGEQVAWINAVLGNSNISALDLALGTLDAGSGTETVQDYLTRTRFAGSYEDYLLQLQASDPELGAWGVDVDDNKVWAVIDHNSMFAASIPEPSSFLLALLGGLPLFRRRRSA